MAMTKLFAAAAAAMLFLTGCVSETARTPIVVEEDANQGVALSVDIITADSQELADAILNSSRGGWFDDKAAYMAEYRDRLAAHHYRFVPGLPSQQEVEWPTLDDSDPIYLIAGNFVVGPRFLKVEPDKLSSIIIASDDIILSLK